MERNVLRSRLADGRERFQDRRYDREPQPLQVLHRRIFEQVEIHLFERTGQFRGGGAPDDDGRCESP